MLSESTEGGVPERAWHSGIAPRLPDGLSIPFVGPLRKTGGKSV